MTVEQLATEHLGETAGAKNHDHDLVHELSRRLDALWRYDQYIANADGIKPVQTFWQKAKAQEQQAVADLKRLIAEHIQNDCF